MPLGVVWDGRTAFVSAQGTLWRTTLSGKSLVGRRALVSRLPYGRHQQDNVVLGPDGRLYFGSGSTCDVCRERDRRSATVLSVEPDGRGLRVEARGLRNPYGLYFDDALGRLYVTVNGQDDLGRWEPAETVVILRRAADYGWPRCWTGWRDGKLHGSCAGVAGPFARLEPHSAAAGSCSGTNGSTWPSGASTSPSNSGRKVVSIDPRTGRVRAFADGFEHPIAFAIDTADGLLVADWGRGTIYRISRR